MDHIELLIQQCQIFLSNLRVAEKKIRPELSELQLLVARMHVWRQWFF